MRHETFIAPPRFIEIHSRGRLPHWYVDEAIYFVTFSLIDALPRRVLLQLVEERERLLRGVTSRQDRVRLDRALELRLDRELDGGRGSCLLRDHGWIVADALRHFDGDRYQLHAWCVMPNHVHVVFYLERGADLPKVLQGWKSWTAHQIGRGVIWQREYFDRVIRNAREYEETCRYVRENPMKAGLRDWPWVA
jgi:REP element-mobilizing transposase RayT